MVFYFTCEGEVGDLGAWVGQHSVDVDAVRGGDLHDVDEVRGEVVRLREELVPGQLEVGEGRDPGLALLHLQLQHPHLGFEPCPVEVDRGGGVGGQYAGQVVTTGSSSRDQRPGRLPVDEVSRVVPIHLGQVPQHRLLVVLADTDWFEDALVGQIQLLGDVHEGLQLGVQLGRQQGVKVVLATKVTEGAGRVSHGGGLEKKNIKGEQRMNGLKFFTLGMAEVLTEEVADTLRHTTTACNRGMAPNLRSSSNSLRCIIIRCLYFCIIIRYLSMELTPPDS